MLPIFKKIFLFSLCILLSSCATGAKQEAMEPKTLSNTNVKQAYQSAISVAQVTGGKTTNPLWVSKISSEAYKASLTNTLKSRGYYNPNGAYRLDVLLVSIKQPVVGVSFTVTSVVDYALHEKSSGKQIFKKTITAPYTAQFSDSLLAATRLRMATEGAARENIRLFIETLEKS